MNQIAAIHARDKRRCWICERSVALADASRDHQKPRGEGGYDKARNYRLAHARCNSCRGRLPVAEVERIKAEMMPCSIEELRQAIARANGRYVQSDVARERARGVHLRPHARYALAKASYRASRKAAAKRRKYHAKLVDG